MCINAKRCEKMDYDGFECARKHPQGCESSCPLFGNPLIAELAVSKSCTLAVYRVAWSGSIDAIDACHHISTTFPLPHCASTIAILATLWETLQNDKGIWVLKGKVVHGFLVWVCGGILQCEALWTCNDPAWSMRRPKPSVKSTSMPSFVFP